MATPLFDGDGFIDDMELCFCPECGLPAEVVSEASGWRGGRSDEIVGVRCIGRHWFVGLRDRLVA